MQPLKAHVKNGRLVLDEPTDLPEGAEVELYLVEDDHMTGEQRAALDRSLDRGLAQLEEGKGIPAEAILEKLRARRT